MEKIFIVPYCHADWAWTFTRRWHEKRYILVFEELLDIIKRYPDFRWYMDTYITQLEPFLKARPLRIGELKKRVSEGKIGVCGTFTNLRPSMVGEETQIRDIIIGKRKFKNLFPDANLEVYAGTVDVSVGHPQMPQMLKLGEYRYFRFWRPHAPLSFKKIPLEFYWIGIDGSKILCSRGCYSGINYSQNLYENFKKEVEEEKELLRTEVRWVSCGMDDTRPLRTPYKDEKIPLFEFIRKWNKKEESKIRFATPIEYFKEIEKYKIPEIKGTLDPCEVSYNAGWGGNYGLFYLRQENEKNLIEAEKWFSIGSIYGYKKDEKIFTELWENHLLSCAHATQWLFEEDFQEIYKKALFVKLKCEDIKQNAMKYLLSLISFKKKDDFVIFNSLPYERREKVYLTISFPTGVSSFHLIDGKNKKLPFQIIDVNEKLEKKWEYKILTKVNLPSSGFTTVSVIPEKFYKKPLRKIDFEIKFEDSEIVEVNYKKEKYSTTVENSFGKINLYKVNTKKGSLHVGPITGKEEVKWKGVEIKNDGEIFTFYYSEGKIGNHEVRRKILVYKDEPKIEIETEIFWKKEDGFLTIEFPKVFKGKIYGDTPFAVEEKNIEEEIYGDFKKVGIERQRENMFYAKSFINYTDGKKSISYINTDATHYYVSFDKSIGNILLNGITYRPGWERFINKTAIGEGVHRFTSFLIFHAGKWNRVNLPFLSRCLLTKPEIVFAETQCKKSKFPGSFSFFEIKNKNLILTSFYKEKNWYFLRFYESEGKKTDTEIVFPMKVKEIYKVNFMGKKMEKLNPGREIKIKIKPWEIVTLKIKF